ncbi:MAG: flagellar assembly peptidoglycan hydrolase FlgJ [Oleispira sp.]|mgnify:CR=1 FL=1|nr:flagellar assembly peptidoglycan hydrolase FlgJ [Oleispira sp.]|tara:strand:- start:6925 stop:8046 length:1122 start_codon:yes stop_codon:yes gene_type:complete
MIASRIEQPQDVYTDLNSLQSINDIGREDKDQALRKVAEQFESMFVKMMMKSMRDANKVFQEDSIMHSPQEDFYQQMYDDQLSVKLTGNQGMGLADVIYRQLNQDYGDVNTREKVQWQPLDDRRKNFSHTIDFKQIEKKNTELNSSPITAEKSGFAIDSSFVKPKKVEVENPELVQSESKLQESVIKVTDLTAEKISAFISPEDFIQKLYPAAEKIAKEMGVSLKAIISQAALETGWGKFMIHGKEVNSGERENSFNFFGIKADHRWDGDTVTVTTHEYREGQRVTEKADFRSYPSIEAGLKDYSQFLQAERYEKAMAAGKNIKQYATELQQAGYATDPEYAKKITRIANSELMNETLKSTQVAQNSVEVPRG